MTCRCHCCAWVSDACHHTPMSWGEEVDASSYAGVQPVLDNRDWCSHEAIGTGVVLIVMNVGQGRMRHQSLLLLLLLLLLLTRHSDHGLVAVGNTRLAPLVGCIASRPRVQRLWHNYLSSGGGAVANSQFVSSSTGHTSVMMGGVPFPSGGGRVVVVVGVVMVVVGVVCVVPMYRSEGGRN